MNYTPEKLEIMTINKSFMGYNVAEVDEIISKVIKDYRSSMDEIDDLKCQMSVLNETVQHYKTIEESMQHCLIIAHHTCDEMRQVATENAKNIVGEAELESQRLIDNARQEVNNIKYSYEDIKIKFNSFKMRSEALINAQLDVLKQLSDE